MPIIMNLQAGESVSPSTCELVDHDAEHGGDGDHKGHVLHHARHIDRDGGTQQELQRERNRHRRDNRGRQDDGERERAVAAEHANPHKGSDRHGYAVLEHDAADKVGIGAKEQRSHGIGCYGNKHRRDEQRQNQVQGTAEHLSDLVEGVAERTLERHKGEEGGNDGLKYSDLLGKEHAERYANRNDDLHMPREELSQSNPLLHMPRDTLYPRTRLNGYARRSHASVRQKRSIISRLLPASFTETRACREALRPCHTV